MGWTPVHCAAFHGRLGCLQVTSDPYMLPNTMYNIGRVSWSCLNEVIKLASIGLLFILPSSYCEMQKTMNILIWYWQIDILQNPIGYFLWMQSHPMSTGISDVYGFLKGAIHCNVKANENEITLMNYVIRNHLKLNFIFIPCSFSPGGGQVWMRLIILEAHQVCICCPAVASGKFTYLKF